MQKYLLTLLFAIALVHSSVHTATTVQEPAPSPPTDTIKDIMISTIKPNAESMWNSVVIEISQAGVKQKAPQTEQEWEELRRWTTTLMEGTNLLAIPGRRVATPGEKAKKPEIELSPEEIEILIDKDRAGWIALSRGLYAASQRFLKAAEAKDTDALIVAGGAVYKACEDCHDKYWYPKGRAVRTP